MGVTGFPGHNKGKKFIKGVGYRTPSRVEAPVTDSKLCHICGVGKATFFSSKDRYCETCFYTEMGGQG